MTMTAYRVDGMTCEHCARAVTEEVAAVEHVTGVEVDLGSGRMEVDSDTEVDFAAIRAAVDEAGDYTVTPVGS